MCNPVTSRADLTVEPLTYDNEIRAAVVIVAAWWILHYRANNAYPDRTPAQTCARITQDLAEFANVPVGEAGTLTTEALGKADTIQDTVPDWDQRALAHGTVTVRYGGTVTRRVRRAQVSP